MSTNRYRVNIGFSYDIETDKDHAAAQLEAEENLNRLTASLLLYRKQIKLDKLKQLKHKILLGEFNVDDVLPYVSRDNRKREYKVGDQTYSVRMDSSRYFVFRENIRCTACGLEGIKFRLEQGPGDKNPHFNLYGIEDGRHILMTKDHVHPKSKGGKNEIKNYQTYCTICNNLKGNNENLSNEHVKYLRWIYNNNKNLPKKKFNVLLDKTKMTFFNNTLNGEGNS